MGEVYQARDTRLNRTVAIKVLPSHLSANPDLKARFDREARAISGLQHPHICVLHDLGSQEGVDFLVMEYLEGETLAERIGRKALTTDEALKIGIEIADALDRAHRSGVVHRDLKPGNVMLTRGGSKLMDFGLAKPQAFAGAQSGAPVFSAAATMTSPQSPITMAGTVVGTLQYMSPEQIQGKEADARSDIFAFGAVLYEMVTGRRAFEGKSQLSVASAILEKEPDPISAIQPLAPKALQRTIQTCLAKDPEERFQSAHDLKLQLLWLRGAGAQDPGAVMPTEKRSAMKFWGAWAVAALAVLASVLLWNMRQTGGQPAVARFLIAAPANGWLDTEGGPPLAISPDGQHVAYVVRSGGSASSMLYLRRMDEFEGTSVPGTEGAAMPFFSPDGQWVGFFTTSRMKKVPVEGGAVVEIMPVTDGAGATWGTDGYIYLGRFWRGGLSRVSQNGGKNETVTFPDPSRKEQGHRWPEMLPDGDSILFSITRNFGASDAEIGVLSIKTRTWRTILPNASNAHYLSTGHLVYAHADTLMAAPFNLKSLSVTGPPVQVLHEVFTNSEDGYGYMAVARSGNLVYASRAGHTDYIAATRVVWVSREGKESPASQTARAYEDLSIAPGQKMAAFTIPAVPVWNIWILDLGRGNLNRLTFSGDNRDPLWSPDGRHVAYTSFRDGHFGIYWSTVDGSSPEQRLAVTQFQPFPKTFTPDGKKLIFTQYDAAVDSNVWEVPLTGDATPVPLKGLDADDSPEISPDGKWLAYESSETGQLEVYVEPYPGPGGKWQVSSGGGVHPLWARDGKEIFYRHGDTIMAATVEMRPNFTADTAHPLFTGRYAHSGRDYETDGSRFLLIQSADQKGPTSLQVVLNWTRELKK